MEKKSLSCMVVLVFAMCLLLTVHSDAVENIFYIDQSQYPLSGPSTIVSLDDGLSIAVINRISKKISKVKHDQVVFERTIENFQPFDLLAVNGALFASSQKSGEIKVLSQIDFSLIKTIPVNKSATFMALSSDRSRIFVSSPLKSADTIGVIDVASRTLLSPPVYAFDLNLVNRLVCHDGKLFATSQISSSIAVYNEKTLQNESKYSFGLVPDDIVISGNYLYLSSIEEQLIRVIDLQTFEKIKDIRFDGSPGRMISDGRQYIYVLNSDRTGKVFRLDTITNEFDDESCFESGNCFYTGANPEDAVISRDGKVLYVANYSDNTITWHFISGKLFVEPRSIIVVKPGDSGLQDGSQNSITLKAGGGSGNYSWSASYGHLSPVSGEDLTGEEVVFIPPQGEDIYHVTVTDNDSHNTASAEIIVVDIRVTPESLTVANLNPKIFNITGGTPPYQVTSLQGGTIELNPGESIFSFSPPDKDGFYPIEVKDKNGAKTYATVELASEGVPVLPPDASRAAIIVAGGPPALGDNILWPEIRSAAENIYKILYTEKEFKKEEIYLLSPVDLDGDGDGFPDSIIRNSQGFLEEKDIKNAFEWASQLKELDQPLLVFLLGHGIPDEFMLNLRNPVHTLAANALKGYLDEYQKGSERQVVVIMDSCHSGSFIDNLSGNGVSIITSTGEENSAFYKDSHSFISYFSTSISKGMNLRESYEDACTSLKDFYAKELCAGKYDSRHSLFQNPQYEDNGDGKYYDLFMDLKTEDGDTLKKISIYPPSRINSSARKSQAWNRAAGYKKNVDAISDMTLSIVSMNSRAVDNLSIGNAVTLKAKVGFAQSNVENVYGVLKPPGMKIPVDSDGIARLSYPQIKLQKTDAENLESCNSEIWATEWNGAVYNGCYEINFYAQSENGSIAFSDSFSFSVYEAPSPPDKPGIEIQLGSNQSGSGESDNKIPSEGSYEYSQGDRLNIDVIEHLSWGYDLYIAILKPDGTLVSFPGLNRSTLFTGSEASIVKWQDERYQEAQLPVIDIELSGAIAHGEYSAGQYMVYALMVPQGTSLFTVSPEYLVFSGSSFFIVP